MKRILCVRLPGLNRVGAKNGPESLSQNHRCYAGPSGEIEGTENPGPGSKYAAASASLPALARWCDQFSPLVGIAPPDCLLLDITGLDHLFGGDQLLAERILRELGRRGIEARIAVADTLGAAWALANAECGNRNAELQVEKIAAVPICAQHPPGRLPKKKLPPFSPPNVARRSEFRIPNSEFVIVVPPGETVRALRTLPVEALRLPNDLVELLRQLGIRQIGQLEYLSRAELTTRLGLELVRRLDQAYGQVDEPLPTTIPPPALRARELIEYPSPRRENIEPVLAMLIDRVTCVLREHGLGALRLECRLECEEKGTAGATRQIHLEVGLFQPTASASHLRGLLEMQLERVAIPGPASAVHLEVTMAAPLVWRQPELFTDISPRRQPRHLAALVERLSSRLGHVAVTRPRRIPDAQPELAYTCDPLVESGNMDAGAIHDRLAPRILAETAGIRGSRGRSTIIRNTPLNRRRAACRNSPGDLPLRPLRLLPRPSLLAVLAVSPDGPPLRFHFHNCEYHIARSWGPERIETGWWRGRPVGRDYYRVETDTGQRFWLFRRLTDEKWFLHGMFE